MNLANLNKSKVDNYQSINVLKPFRKRRSKLYLPLGTTILSDTDDGYSLEFTPKVTYTKLVLDDFNNNPKNLGIIHKVDYVNFNSNSKITSTSLYLEYQDAHNYHHLANIKTLRFIDYQKSHLLDINGKKVRTKNQLSPIKVTYNHSQTDGSYEIVIDCHSLIITCNQHHVIAVNDYQDDYILIGKNVLRSKQITTINVRFSPLTNEVNYYINDKLAKTYESVCAVSNALFISLCLCRNHFINNDHFKDFHNVFYGTLIKIFSDSFLLKPNNSNDQLFISQMGQNVQETDYYIVYRYNNFFAGEFNQSMESHYIAYYFLLMYKDLINYDMSNHNKLMFFFLATDLNIIENDAAQKKQQQRIKKLLTLANKGKTHEFKSVFLHDFDLPKSIAKELFSMPFMCITSNSVYFIHQLCQRFNVDHVRNLLQAINRFCGHYPYSIGNPKSLEYILMTVKHLIQMGYTFSKIVNMYKRIKYYRHYYDFNIEVNDTIRMQRFLVEHNHPSVFRANMSLTEYHDELSYRCKLINDQINKSKHPYLFEPVVSKKAPLSSHGLTVRPLKQIIEMRDIAYHLSICVDTYMNSQAEEKLEIFVVVDDKDRYVACLEVASNRLCQAKLYKNAPLENNLLAYDVVQQWAKANKIKFSVTES